MNTYYSKDRIDGIISTAKTLLRRGHRVGPQGMYEALLRQYIRSQSFQGVEFEDPGHLIDNLQVLYNLLNPINQPDVEHDNNKLERENEMLKAQVDKLKAQTVKLSTELLTALVDVDKLTKRNKAMKTLWIERARTIISLDLKLEEKQDDIDQLEGQIEDQQSKIYKLEECNKYLDQRLSVYEQKYD